MMVLVMVTMMVIANVLRFAVKSYGVYNLLACAGAGAVVEHITRCAWDREEGACGAVLGTVGSRDINPTRQCNYQAILFFGQRVATSAQLRRSTIFSRVRIRV